MMHVNYDHVRTTRRRTVRAVQWKPVALQQEEKQDDNDNDNNKTAASAPLWQPPNALDVARYLMIGVVILLVSTSLRIAVDPRYFYDTFSGSDASFLDRDRHVADHEQIVAVDKSVPYQGKYAVFYNIYANSEIYRLVSRIKREQFNEIRASSWKNANIYYTMIGYDLQNICPDDFEGRCFRLNYFKEGWEEKTLTEVYRYCLQNPNDTVAYIHNKGSHHNNLGNQRNRRLATKSALSEACHDIPYSNFNVCGFRFNVLPYFHFSTNLWTARCDYIVQLVPPRHYSDLRVKMYQTFLDSYGEELCRTEDEESVANNSELVLGTITNDHTYPQHNGFLRWAMERWITSHPRFAPAQVFGDELAKFLTGLEPWTPRLRSPMKYSGRQLRETRQVIKLQMKQYFYLYGEYAPKGGCCEEVFSLVDPPVCTKQNFAFGTINETEVHPLVEEEHKTPFILSNKKH